MRIKGTRKLAPISAALAILTLVFVAVLRYTHAPLPRFLVLPTFIASLLSCLTAAIIMLIEGKRTGTYARKKYIILAFCVNGFILLALFAIKHAIGQRAACINNLGGINGALKAYAIDNRNTFPPIDNVKNNFIFDANVLYPEYMSDLSLLVCPSDPNLKPKKAFRLRSVENHPDSSIGDVHPDCVTGDSYCYLGWVLTSDTEAEAFFEAYDRLSPDEYGKDLHVPEGKGNPHGPLPGEKKIVRSGIIYRLNTQIDNKMSYDGKPFIGSREGWESSIPVIWETIPRHISPYRDPIRTPIRGGAEGALVLYLDGHVGYVPLGERFPMTETMARLLEKRRREPIPDCD